MSKCSIYSPICIKIKQWCKMGLKKRLYEHQIEKGDHKGMMLTSADPHVPTGHRRSNKRLTSAGALPPLPRIRRARGGSAQGEPLVSCSQMLLASCDGDHRSPYKGLRCSGRWRSRGNRGSVHWVWYFSRLLAYLRHLGGARWGREWRLGKRVWCE